MTRPALVEKMLQTFGDGIGSPIERMSSVLDLLTKEAVEGVAGWGAPSPATSVGLCGESTGCHSQWHAVFTKNGGGLSGGVTPTQTTPRPVQAIILDLPSMPSVEARAADLLRSMAKVVDGIDADVLEGAAEEAREIADELEKEARDG